MFRKLIIVLLSVSLLRNLSSLKVIILFEQIPTQLITLNYNNTPCLLSLSNDNSNESNRIKFQLIFNYISNLFLNDNSKNRKQNLES